MSISYQPKDDRVLSVALKVQELVVRKSDPFVTVVGLDVTVDVGEPVVGSAAGEAKPIVIHCDDSIGLSLVASSGTAVSGSQITASLSNAMADADALIVRYVVKE